MVVTENLPDPPTRASETSLIDALRDGDEAAFRQVVTDLNPGLTRLARTYVPNALAEEVVQETWATVIGSIDSFEARSSLKTWIFRIMLNKVRTLAGRESKIIPFAAMGPAAGSGDGEAAVSAERLQHDLLGPGHWPAPPEVWHQLPAEILEREEILMMILEAIAALPPAQREVVELRDVQGWAPNEVCDALGITSVNQRVLLHRGRSMVRSMLEEYLAL